MASAFIHPTAVVDDDVTLGDGAAVWHFSHVSAGAVIGAGTKLGQNAFVGRGVKVGARVKVQNNVSIYEGVEIDDDAFVGPSVVFTNVKTPRAFVDRRGGFERTRVGKGASLGANAVVVCGRTIGPYAMVGAGAVVVDDVPAHAIVVGNPARAIGWASIHGERLAHVDGDTWACPATGERYRVIGDVCTPIGAEASSSAGPLPFVDLARAHAPIAGELVAAFDRVLSRGRFILGDEVRAFEAEAAARVGARFAIGVSSGTDAILATLMALGVSIGDEVITSPFSFFAGVESILRLGATPVFVDLDARGFHVDPSGVAAAIGPRTKAILLPHLFGGAFSRDVARIARERGVPLVEDAAQAFGASPAGEGPRCGAMGAAGCFSFFPTKALGALGDGGLVTTDDEALADAVRALRSHGTAKKYEHARVGGNFRLDELQAAFLRVKLARFDDVVAHRRRLAQRYLTALEGFAPSRLTLPDLGAGDTAAYFVVRCTSSTAGSPAHERDALAAHLGKCGIATEVYYPSALHLQPAVLALHPSGPASAASPARGPGAPSQGWSATRKELGGSFPRAEQACSEALALPLHDAMTEPQVDRVARAIADFLF